MRENLLTPEFCEEEGHRQDNRASIVRTPNGTYPHLTPSMKESICVYANLEDFLTAHDPGWSYIGLQDGVFHRFPAIPRMRGIEGGDELLNGCEPYDPRLRPWHVMMLFLKY